MKYLLGIDLGTTGLKASIFSLDGDLLGRGYTKNGYLSRPQGWAEQDPRTWWTGCCQAIQSALAESQISPKSIGGIGICGFHHCPVFLDKDGEPVRSTIVTHDIRLSESLEDLKQHGLVDEITKISGSAVTTGHFPPIYHYVFHHDRQILERTRWILLAKDYLRFKLTGKIGTEICDATGTHLIAMPAQTWSDSLCGLLNVPEEKLPEIGIPGEIAGEVTQEAAREIGLQTGIPVAFGGGDSHCALLGLGVTRSAEVGILLGTNSTLRASFQGFIGPSVPSWEGQGWVHSSQQVWKQQHVVPGKYTVSSSSMAGSSVLSWFKEMFCKEFEGIDDAGAYRELESLASAVKPGCEGLLFHPYLYGERSPFYNPKARGAFLAVAYWHAKGHFVRSVMEGVAFSITNCFDVLQEIARQRDEEIQTVRIGEGGGSRSKLWRQIISDTLELPIEVMRVEEPGCLGAALLAGVGIGVYDDIQDAVQQTVHLSSQTLPDVTCSAIYQERRTVFNKTFQVLEPILYE